MSGSMSPSEDISTREMIFRFLVDYKREHDGNTPTIREIADACNLSSPSTVHYHLFKLEADFRIRTYGKRRRNIEIVGASWDFPDAREGWEHASPSDRHEPDGQETTSSEDTA